MKCPNCGANLVIDDAVCTFCGTENPYAKQHRKEMRHFTKEFNKTKTSVLGKSRNINSFVIKIAMIVPVQSAANGINLFGNFSKAVFNAKPTSKQIPRITGLMYDGNSD